MSYQIVEFDNIALPLYNPRQDMDVAPVESTLLESVGGIFDYYGQRQRYGRRQVITVSGIYLGEDDYWVDDENNQIVDHDGDNLVFGYAADQLRSMVSALYARQGLRGRLVRLRNDGEEEYKWARLLAVKWGQKPNPDRDRMAELVCTFETNYPGWRATAPSSADVSLATATPGVLAVQVGGTMPVADGVVTVECTGGTITEFVLTGPGVSWRWLGSLEDDDLLVVDAGAKTVRKNGVDAYSGWTLGVDHTTAGWLLLPPGSNNITVMVTGGSADVSLSHEDQWL